MTDPNDHGALIATALERVNAQQRDIDGLDDDIERVELSLGDRIGKLEDSVKELVGEIRQMRVENAERAGEARMLKRIIAVVLAIGGVIATLFSGLLVPPHH